MGSNFSMNVPDIRYSLFAQGWRRSASVSVGDSRRIEYYGADYLLFSRKMLSL